MSCCAAGSPARARLDRPAGRHQLPPRDGGSMVSLPGGAFVMGTDDETRNEIDGEGPVHEVSLSAFHVDAHAVSNERFAEFVDATGYATQAEQYGSSCVFAGLLPEDTPPYPAVAAAPWWLQVPGAGWMHPEGPGSTIDDRLEHPVVHVSWYDAVAFCTWSRTTLPTEAQWEYAARGGLEQRCYPWGEEREPAGRHAMNVFQGDFPVNDTGEDGYVGTAPVYAYSPNGFGLFNVTGNVWEWCEDTFDPDAYRHHSGSDPAWRTPGAWRVMRGGSYLCHESYCNRYRVAARGANTAASSAGNLGFRVVAG